MTVTIAKINKVSKEEAYMGNDKTYFTDADGIEAYTFASIFEGQSYDGFYKTDRGGKTQFKKDPTPGANYPQQNAQTSNAPSVQPGLPLNNDSVKRFEEAVKEFGTYVSILAGLDKPTQTRVAHNPQINGFDETTDGKGNNFSPDDNDNFGGHA